MKHLLVGLSAFAVVACGSNQEPEETTETPTAETNPPTPTEETPEATPDEPEAEEGPVFRTTMMGVEQTAPIAAKTLGETGLTIQAPETARVEGTLESDGIEIVDATVNYSVSIRSGTFESEAQLSLFQTLDENGSVILNEDDRIIFRRANEGSFLFSTGITVGEDNYVCSTMATAFAFTRDQVDQMLESCRTLSLTAAEANDTGSTEEETETNTPAPEGTAEAQPNQP